VSRSGRREKAEAQLRKLEEQFSKDLVSALRECAAGKWGMFGRNDEVIEADPLRDMLKSKIGEQLIEQGEAVVALHERLGLTEPFWPFRRYLQYRQSRGSNTPGEPKLALEFLRELGTES
jgi:hypothetical protein